MRLRSGMAEGMYPIRAAARLTRLTMDTMRAWERRHGAVSPARKNGIRLYSKADIERLSMLRDAVGHGHSIGHVSGLSTPDLRKLLSHVPRAAAAARPTRAAQDPLRAIVAAVENYSYAAADQELGRMAMLLSPRDLVYQVALPLMQLAGQRWHDQRMRVAQEHMLTQLLGNLLGGMLRLYTPSNPPATVLTATLSGDLHAFGILAASMLVASAGLGVTDLGPNLPLEEVSYAAKRSNARAVLISITWPENLKECAGQLVALRSRIPANAELWVAVNPASLVSKLNVKRKGIHWIKDFAELEHELKRMGGRF